MLARKCTSDKHNCSKYTVQFPNIKILLLATWIPPAFIAIIKIMMMIDKKEEMLAYTGGCGNVAYIVGCCTDFCYDRV